jgi:uncharacterized protein
VWSHGVAIDIAKQQAPVGRVPDRGNRYAATGVPDGFKCAHAIPPPGSAAIHDTGETDRQQCGKAPDRPTVRETFRMTEPFAPFQDLADFLLNAFDANEAGGAHDLSHLVRVWRNAVHIARTEPGCDLEILLAAAILHDCVAVEKSSPQRPFASRLSAAKAREVVAPLQWTPARVDGLAHVIETHSFSAGLAPETMEAKIFRDADRLDAIGAIGIARCFHVGGRMDGALYDLGDPGAKARPLDDRAYALDHFAVKLFKEANAFLTQEGQRLAAVRTQRMTDFVIMFRAEIEGE